ncbi:MAG TPA: PAS domain-containing protein, partial [Anseongella sp.]|nr:PAS domain-containing protein [Anseongella sp.]
AIRLTIKPLAEPDALKGLFLVVFEDLKRPENQEESVPEKTTDQHENEAKLQKELHFTKTRLQTALEEMQTSLEELKSTNEELQSANEELQSTNEEAMTNKEEMQSLNEELLTINMQYQAKAEEFTKANNDMKNLLDSTEIGTVFLDVNLNIRNFTNKATQVFNLIRGDLGRPVLHISSNLKYDNLEQDINEVLTRLVTKEFEAATVNGQEWFLVRIMPYRTADNFIDGVVLTLTNITRFKQLERELEESRTFAENIINAVSDALVVLNEDLRVIAVSKSFSDTFNVIPEQTKGQLVYNLGNGQWNIPELRRLLDKVFIEGIEFNDYLVEHNFPGIGFKRMRLHARSIQNNPEKPQLILLNIRDITPLTQPN